MNNLPKVVTQQRRGQASNPRLLDRKSDALPLSHRARTFSKNDGNLQDNQKIQQIQDTIRTVFDAEFLETARNGTVRDT